MSSLAPKATAVCASSLPGAAPTCRTRSHDLFCGCRHCTRLAACGPPSPRAAAAPAAGPHAAAVVRPPTSATTWCASIAPPEPVRN
eukprot:2382001-Prymnesium_polylepis.1